MVSGWERALQALCALAYLATVADAFRLPFLALPTRRLGGDAAGPRVTAPPSPGAVDLRFRRQNNGGGGLQCASSCVSAAVTKSTNCQVDDVICGCQADNAYKILYGAEVCIVLTCGYQAYVSKSKALGSAPPPQGWGMLVVPRRSDADGAGAKQPPQRNWRIFARLRAASHSPPPLRDSRPRCRHWT